jgi:hypothetical protein
MIVAMIVTMAVIAMAESKYSSSSTGVDPSVTFGAQPGHIKITAISGSVDVINGGVKLYARKGAAYDKLAPVSNHVVSTTVLVMANPGAAFTNSDTVIYQHANGVADYDVVASATTNSVTLTTGITVAGVAGDYLYEISQKGFVPIGDSTTMTGTNKVGQISGAVVFETPGDSPLYATSDCATNGCLMLTVQ